VLPPAFQAVRPLLILLPFAALLALKPWLPEWAIVWPENLVPPLIDWINAVTDFLRKEKLVAGLTFKDMTRATAKTIEWPLNATNYLFVKGFGEVPPLPWLTVVGLAAVLGWWLKGWKIALLGGFCIFYFALFGKWKLSMTTLSAVLVAATLAEKKHKHANKFRQSRVDEVKFR
jgi:glycine betaine/proline transport system permease protein